MTQARERFASPLLCAVRAAVQRASPPELPEGKRKENTMDLDALDTAYGAEQIDTDLLETDIRSRLEYTLRNETYCGRDPFGKKRYGADSVSHHWNG